MDNAHLQCILSPLMGGFNIRILSCSVTQAVARGVLCFIIGAVPSLARGQRITVDGRLSPAQTLVGPNYSIPESLGRQVGGNLFHSFGTFSLTRTETATFSGPATVNNIVGRVTGGTSSSIDGTIKSTIPGASLFLINPSGIVFGPNAAVNVTGSFHASTADYVRLSDGGRFQATNPDGSTLTAAPPAAFGFFNAPLGTITVNGAQLAVNPGQTVGLVGGPVTIGSGTTAIGQTAGASLTAPSGTIHLSSAAAAGEIPVDPTNTSGASVNPLGSVNIAGGSTLDVSNFANKGVNGSIFIKSSRLQVAEGSVLDGTNYGASTGGQISLRGDSQIELTSGALIHAPGTAAGRGGDISLTTAATGSVTASGGALVDVGSSSVRGSVPSGGAGRLTVNTGDLTLSGGAIFGSDVQGSGNAGPIVISATSIQIDGRSTASSAALTGIRSVTQTGSANAADMSINAGSLSILANGEIVSNTRGSGRAGGLSVTVAGALSIDATTAAFSTGIGTVVSPNATGSAGDMTVNAASLSLVGNPGLLTPSTLAPNPFSGLSTQTLGGGNGGTIALTVGNGLTAMSNGGVISSTAGGAGQGGALSITTQGPLSMTGAGTAITAASLAGGSGNAGSVTVSALQVTMQSGAQITSATGGTGAGGPVRVTSTGALALDGNGTQIAASATGPLSGPGGAVTVSVGSLNLTNGGQITSTTDGVGNGGAIAVMTSDDIVLSGTGSQITARSTSSGDAGSILVSATNMKMTNGAAISTEATTANGGNISITVPDFLHLVGSSITTSVKAARGNGGNITIDPRWLVLDDSQIIAQAVLGHGGNITIVADQFLPSSDSVVSATSSLGISGNHRDCRSAR